MYSEVDRERHAGFVDIQPEKAVTVDDRDRAFGYMFQGIEAWQC